MSKYFDETRKAQQAGRGEGTSQGPDIEHLLSSVKEGGAVAKEVGDWRLRSSPKIHLAYPGELPLISYNGSGRDEHSQVALEAYRALRTRLLRLQTTSGLCSVVISSAIPGEGKTLTSINLALSCVQLRDMRVLLIDADLRTRGLTRLLGSPAGPTLSEALAGQAEFEQVVLATDLPNLYAVAAGTAPAPTPELFTGPRWKEFIGWCSESFKLILVDSPPMLSLADFELISNGCDGVLVVVRALTTQRELLRKAAGQADAKKLLGVVFNATELKHGSRSYYYKFHSLE